MSDLVVKDSDRQVSTFSEQVACLIDRGMEIEGYSAYLDWSEDFEPPSKLVRGLVGRVLEAAEPATREALARLLQSSLKRL